MRRIIIAISCLLLASVASAAGTSIDWLTGSWQGAIERNGSIQIIQFEIHHSDTGWYASFNVPELMLFDQPVRDFSVTDSVVRLHILYGMFEMHCFPDIEQMTGTNPKWNPEVRLHLKKLGDPIDYWFIKREIRFSGGADPMSGTLLVPKGSGPFPAVVITHGGGDSTRGEWAYRAAAYGLTRQGVATFIYDQRGHGESGGDPNATLWDHAQDALAAVSAIRRLPEISPGRVGLYGPSRGGWVASIAAAESDSLGFIVLMQGPALSVEQQDIDGIERTMTSQDLTKQQIDSALQQARLYFQYVDGKIDFALYNRKSYLRQNIGWTDFGHFVDSANDQDVAWWRANKYDPANDLSHARCPVMAVFGENDTYVSPESNLDSLAHLVASSGQPFRSIVIPHLPHAVATYQTLREGKWDWPDGFWVWSYRPPLLDKSVAEWIKEL